jgi:hypothetical protein
MVHHYKSTHSVAFEHLKTPCGFRFHIYNKQYLLQKRYQWQKRNRWDIVFIPPSYLYFREASVYFIVSFFRFQFTKSMIGSAILWIPRNSNAHVYIDARLLQCCLIESHESISVISTAYIYMINQKVLLYFNLF